MSYVFLLLFFPVALSSSTFRAFCVKLTLVQDVRRHAACTMCNRRAELKNTAFETFLLPFTHHSCLDASNFLLYLKFHTHTHISYAYIIYILCSFCCWFSPAAIREFAAVTPLFYLSAAPARWAVYGSSMISDRTRHGTEKLLHRNVSPLHTWSVSIGIEIAFVKSTFFGSNFRLIIGREKHLFALCAHNHHFSVRKYSDMLSIQ